MRFLFAYIKNKQYLCTAFSVREAGESPAQSRCCDSQSDVQILISHWLTVNCQLTKLGRLNKRSDKSEDLLRATNEELVKLNALGESSQRQ